MLRHEHTAVKIRPRPENIVLGPDLLPPGIVESRLVPPGRRGDAVKSLPGSIGPKTDGFPGLQNDIHLQVNGGRMGENAIIFESDAIRAGLEIWRQVQRPGVLPVNRTAARHFPSVDEQQGTHPGVLIMDAVRHAGRRHGHGAPDLVGRQREFPPADAGRHRLANPDLLNFKYIAAPAGNDELESVRGGKLDGIVFEQQIAPVGAGQNPREGGCQGLWAPHPGAVRPGDHGPGAVGPGLPDAQLDVIALFP